MKKLIYLFAVVAAVFAVSCSSTPATPGGAALNIYQLMVDGKYEAVADEFYFETENPEEAAEGRALIVSLMNEKAGPQIEAKGGISALEVVEEVVAEDGQTAKVTIKVTYGNGKEDTNKLDLVKDPNGDWKAAFKK